MIQLPAGAWFGVVQDQPGGEVRLVFSCSPGCLRRLLRED